MYVILYRRSFEQHNKPKIIMKKYFEMVLIAMIGNGLYDLIVHFVFHIW